MSSHKDFREEFPGHSQHVQWSPVYDGKGWIEHWVCSCGAIVPDPPDPHPEESLEFLIEEMVRAARELLATPVREGEDLRLSQLRRDLQAAVDEYDRTET